MVITRRPGMESSSCSNLTNGIAASLTGIAPRSFTMGPWFSVYRITPHLHPLPLSTTTLPSSHPSPSLPPSTTAPPPTLTTTLPPTLHHCTPSLPLHALPPPLHPLPPSPHTPLDERGSGRCVDVTEERWW